MSDLDSSGPPRRRKGPPKRDRDLETRFADHVRDFEAFPGFDSADFEAFLPPKQRDPSRNGERLIVKRKLAALGDALAPRLVERGLDLTQRTSLSHPYKHNGFRVASISVYWGRSDKVKKELRSLLGEELASDADATYLGAFILIEVDEVGVRAGLRIHPKAWWDGQSLKKRVLASAKEAEALAKVLNALPAGYAMTLGDWKKRYESGKLTAADTDNYFKYYKPGETWLHLLHETPRAEAIAAGAGLQDALGERIAALAPVYTFAAWSTTNDRALGGG